MVLITEQLIRKKSEHNELMIGTLEELSLHQEHIEKIEYIHNWCRDLKILLMQSNLISKIENLSKLKKLEYLNLALNNIEKIENVAGLESLNKLDLTLNFIGDLTSVENLKENIHLKELILTGNPVTDFEGYRGYVITVLPQLEILDGTAIKRNERIVARREFASIRNKIIQLQAQYVIERDEQKMRIQRERERQAAEFEGLTEQEISERFWKTKSENCPETRTDISNHHRKNQNLDTEVKKKKKKRERRLFADSGRPYNINEAKVDFLFKDEASYYELDLHVYKFLETSLIDVDVQPNLVRVTIKKKIFQLELREEVKITESTSQRSQITGHLVIVMPKASSKGEILISKTDIKFIAKTPVIDESEVPPLC